MAKKIIIAGGGTGGHIFPAIAIANAIKKLEPETRILFVGARGKMEMEKVPLAGYDIVGLYIAGYNRSSMLKNLGLPYKLLRSFLQVRIIFRNYQPDAVIGVGGYSSFPVLKLAQTKGIPTFIHESNSFAGKSNIMLGRRASKIFVASDGMEKFFPAEKIEITGNPVRTSISNAKIGRKEAVEYFGLNETMKTVFVVGGSLGAKSINEAVANKINVFKENNLQLIWQTGKLFTDRATKLAEGNKNIWTNEFISNIEYAYAAADVVISRSGAMAIAELCVAGKPVVFVPYPFAAEDHQTANANWLVNKKAAVMVKDSEAGTRLIDTALHLIQDEALAETLKQNILKLANTDADDRIAAGILKILNEKN